MPLTATFKADFSSFYDEANKATAALQALDNESKKVNASVNEIKAPANLAKMGESAGKAGQETRTLKEAYQDFDKLLAAGGVNIGTQVQALGELANVAGKSATQLGLMATAGTAVGAALAGWQIGRQIAELVSADEFFRKTGEGILFYKAALDAATAGAKQDVINRAVAAGADASIKYADALKVVDQVWRDHQVTVDTSTTRIANWEKELDKVRKAGHFEQLNAELNSQNFELKELQTRYDVSAGALNYLARQNKDAADAAREENDAVKALQATWKETADIMADFAVKSHAIAMKAMAEERAERAKQLKETNDTIIAGLEQIKGIQAEYTDSILKSTLSETDYKIAKINEERDARIAAFQGTQEQAASYSAFVNELADSQIAKLRDVTTAVTQVGDEYSAMYKQATEGVLVIGKSADELAAVQQKGAKETGDAVVDEYRRQQEAFLNFKGVVVAGTREMTASTYAVAQALSLNSGN